MAATVAGPPDPDAGRVDRRKRAGVGDRMPVVAHLLPGIDLLAGFAVTRTKIAIIEDECPKPRLDKDFGKGLEIHFLHRRKTVRHDDRGPGSRRAIWQIEPTAYGHPFGIERDLLSHNAVLLSLHLSVGQRRRPAVRRCRTRMLPLLCRIRTYDPSPFPDN